jgi:periplasmic protein TorT
MKLRFVAALLGATALGLPSVAQDAWFPYPAEEVTPAFAADGTSAPVSYEALPKAEKAWDICVSFPHMKDAYWSKRAATPSWPNRSLRSRIA